MRVLLVHLLPNVGNLLIVALTLGLGSVAASEVGLTYLGIGVQPPHPSFGAMISEAVGLQNVREHTHLILVPGIFVSALVLSFNLLGDQITDVLSPRRR
jgi:peptide/nickel transport system permease protein